MRAELPLAAVLAVMSISGCGVKPHAATSATAEVQPMAKALMADVASSGVMSPPQAPAPQSPQGETQRYIAERQTWIFELGPDGIEPRWKKHMALCTGACEVVSASINKSSQSTTTAWLELRVPRQAATALFAAMDDKSVVDRNVFREDRTIQVVDTDARLSNQIELRTRLRSILGTTSGKLPDLLRLEQELARVQGEIDATTSVRRVLAQETEKVFLRAEYRPAPSITETGALQPLTEAWHRLGYTFAESAGTALTTIAGLLPWLLVVVPGLLVVHRFVYGKKQKAVIRN